MNKYIKKCTAAFLLLILMVGCKTEENENLIQITASIGKKGQPVDAVDRLYQLGDTLVYKFEVTSPNGIEKIEFSNYTGVGVNRKAPTLLKKYQSIVGLTWIYVDTIENIQDDIRYSIYIEDNNKNFKSAQINALLDITRYLDNPIYPYPSPLIILKDGLSNGTSKTFLNIESGRTFYLSNIEGDPTGIDLGFAYLENNLNIKACLVSFDEYWRTGNYPQILNSLNNSIIFRKSTDATSDFGIKDKIRNAENLKQLFEQSGSFPTNALFPEDKIAPNLANNNIIAFKTNDNRYGAIQIFKINRKSESPMNTQEISMYLIVQKNNILN